jgi:hypothetical protein
MLTQQLSAVQIVFAVLGGWGIGIYTAMKASSAVLTPSLHEK